MLQNLRHAARSLRKSPTLTLAVVLTLAVCIGATTAVFSVVYAVLFRPLPFAAPDGVLLFREVWRGMPGSVSVGNWADTQREDRLFQQLVPMQGTSVNLAGSEVPENVTAARVGADFFSLLGVPPVLTDPPTLATGTVVLALVALAAALLPAQRAARVDPAVALRAD